jgi:hypothetical protein
LDLIWRQTGADASTGADAPTPGFRRVWNGKIIGKCLEPSETCGIQMRHTGKINPIATAKMPIGIVLRNQTFPCFNHIAWQWQPGKIRHDDMTVGSDDARKISRRLWAIEPAPALACGNDFCAFICQRNGLCVSKLVINGHGSHRVELLSLIQQPVVRVNANDLAPPQRKSPGECPCPGSHINDHLSRGAYSEIRQAAKKGVGKYSAKFCVIFCEGKGESE